jgi:hypothetical protein
LIALGLINDTNMTKKLLFCLKGRRELDSMIKQDLNIVDFVKVFKRDRFVDDTLNHVKNIIAKNKETLKRR